MLGSLKFLLGFFAVFFALFLGLLLLGLFAFLVFTPKAPSDEKMISLLHKNLAAFETLVDMCYEDQKLADRDWITTNLYGPTQLPPERLQQYKEQFSKTSIVKGVSCRQEEVTLRAFSSGLSISGRQKYYVYKPLSYDDFELVPTLDSDLKFDESTGSTRAIRHIEGLWYLAYYGT